jgi:hypothetical protein
MELLVMELLVMELLVMELLVMELLVMELLVMELLVMELLVMKLLMMATKSIMVSDQIVFSQSQQCKDVTDTVADDMSLRKRTPRLNTYYKAIV